MAKVALDQVLEQVKMLMLDEKRQLRQMLDDLLESSPPESLEEELARRLQKAGLIITRPPPITDFTPYQNRKLVKVKGKPVSEVLIEDRDKWQHISSTAVRL